MEKLIAQVGSNLLRKITLLGILKKLLHKTKFFFRAKLILILTGRLT